MQYRISLDTYVVIEAESQEDARREFKAYAEDIGKSDSIEQDAVLNAEIINISEEE